MYYLLKIIIICIGFHVCYSQNENVIYPQNSLNIWNDTIYIIQEINATYIEIYNFINLLYTIVPNANSTIFYANYTLLQANLLINNINVFLPKITSILNKTETLLDIILNLMPQFISTNNKIQDTTDIAQSMLKVILYIILPILTFLILIYISIGLILLIKMICK